jgi:hypothetical protein
MKIKQTNFLRPKIVNKEENFGWASFAAFLGFLVSLTYFFTYLKYQNKVSTLGPIKVNPIMNTTLPSLNNPKTFSNE